MWRKPAGCWRRWRPAWRNGSTIRAFAFCAFINTAVELADLLPESLHIASQHKRQMADELARHLPASPQREQHSAMLAMLIDGAIVRVQIERQPQAALQVLNATLDMLAQGGFDQ